MSLQLTTDEMLEALHRIKHPMAADLTAMCEAAANTLARVLCDTLQIDMVAPATFQGVEFGGLYAPLIPSYVGQPMPVCFEGLDEDEEWDGEVGA